MYEIRVNVCDGKDYVDGWTVGEFHDEDAALAAWRRWEPDLDVMRRVAERHWTEGDAPLDEWDVQYGVWDEDGNELAFESWHLGT